MPKKYQYTRPQKGESLLDSFSDYVVIDLETTGLDPQYDSIIEISAIKVNSGRVSDEFSYLVKPNGFSGLDEFITELTGITDVMLENAPSLDTILPLFRDFIGDSVLVGHNVNFDINFLYDEFMHYFGTPLTNNFVDTMRLARSLYKEEKHLRLPDVARLCNVQYENAHRALSDCLITQQCYVSLISRAIELYSSMEQYKSSVKNHFRKRITEFQCDGLHIDENNLFFGRSVVFTGKLDGITREEAMQMVVNIGGHISKSVSKKTDYLVVGSLEYSSSIKGGKSQKIKDAEKYNLEGGNIEVISQNVFVDAFFN